MPNTPETSDRSPVDADIYTGKPLTFHNIAQSWALARTIDPSIGCNDWRDRLAPFITTDAHDTYATRGAFSVQNPFGYIVGLFCYAACDDSPYGRILRVENLLAVDLFDAAGAMAVLVRKMAELARTLDCRTVEVDRSPVAEAAAAFRRLSGDWFIGAASGDSGPLILRPA